MLFPAQLPPPYFVICTGCHATRHFSELREAVSVPQRETAAARLAAATDLPAEMPRLQPLVGTQLELLPQRMTVGRHSGHLLPPTIHSPQVSRRQPPQLEIQFPQPVRQT